MKKQKFDLIFSLGAACPTSMLLRKHRLQKSSYPLDWIGGDDNFFSRVQILCHHFDDFINKADLQSTEQTYMDRGGLRRLVFNTKNGLLFNHDFSGEKSLEEDYPRIFEKYQRRIKRLLQTIQNSQKILIVFQEKAIEPHCLKNNIDLISAYHLLNKTFPDKSWHILYFSNNHQMSHTEIKEEQISPFITKISANYPSLKQNDADWAVNEKLLHPIYTKLQLKKSFKTAFSENLILTMGFFIPFRGIKRKFLGHFFKNYFEI